MEDIGSLEIPRELIAQYPPTKRDTSRVMIVWRNKPKIEHKIFKDIKNFLSSQNLLILNRTKVLKARLEAKKKTKGKVEILLTRIIDNHNFEALLGRSRGLKQGDSLFIESDTVLSIKKRREDGIWTIGINREKSVLEILDRYGEPPLPPYIKRKPQKEDEKWYQTEFAEIPGSVAAPTAGLHFTKDLLKELRDIGVAIEYITLHIGPGSFKLIKGDIKDHRMDKEYYEIPVHLQDKIAKAKSEGKTIIACGTSTTRALESWGLYGKTQGYTELFITPGYRFRTVDGLITNFHLPNSTHILIVQAILGIDRTKKLYRIAIEKRYRFYSYGDSMLIMP